MMFLMLVLSHCFFLFVELQYENFIDSFLYIGYEMLPFYLFGVGGLFLVYLLTAVYAWFKQNNQVPLRFNREKREVCLVMGKRIVIAPWENISAQVESAILVTPYSFTSNSTLTLQIPNFEKEGEVLQLAMGYAAEALAIAEWEAIRVYMEEGLQALHNKTKTPDDIKLEQDKDPAPKGTTRYYNQLLAKYPEGSPDYFYALKAKNKLAKKGYRWWCFYHACSGWTLPCHLAAWLNRHPAVRRPKAMRQWSPPFLKNNGQSPVQNCLSKAKYYNKLIQKVF